MTERISKEITLLKDKYPNLQVGEDFVWAMIPDFPLPNGYNRKQTKLLFLIPKTYPHTPPDNFYVESGLRLSNGNQSSNYSEGAGVPIPGSWGCFSWHSEIWKPSDDILKGDNLTSFIRSVNIRLRENR